MSSGLAGLLGKLGYDEAKTDWSGERRRAVP